MPSKQPTKYVSEPLPLVCPVCKKVFTQPIISVKCGHTFCRTCIEELIKNGQTCPLDEQVCESSQLVLNRAIMGQLEDLQIYCQHGLRPVNNSAHPSTNQDEVIYERDPEGCPEVVKIGERDKHEESCPFAWVECPVGREECGRIRKMKLEEHVEACTRIPCPFTDFGCHFVGSRHAVTLHKDSCTFKDEAHVVAVTMRELKSLKLSNEELQKSLCKATKAIEKLSSERGMMITQLEQQALTITSLTSRMDKLETDMEAYKSVRPRNSTRRNNNVDRGEATPRYSRREKQENNKRWSTDSLYLESPRGPFRWQMPFTVKCIGTFRGHQGTIWSLAATSGHLYSGSSDGSIKMWDVLDLRRGCLRTVSAHKDGALCMTTGRGILFSAGMDLAIRSWNVESLEEIGCIKKAHDGTASALICSKHYLFASFLGCIKIWDALTLNEVHKIDSISQSWVRALAYDKKKDLLYSCSSNKIHIWKGYEDFSLVNEVETLYGALYSITTTKRYVITGTHSQNIQIYAKESMQHLHTLSGHIGKVTVLCVVDSQAEYMFSGSSDASVTVWDLENMLPILTLQRHEKAVYALAVWQDSVFTGSEDMEIKVFRHFKL